MLQSMPTGFQEQKTSVSALSKIESRMKLTPSQETFLCLSFWLSPTPTLSMQGTKIACLWMSALSPHPSLFFSQCAFKALSQAFVLVALVIGRPIRPSVSFFFHCLWVSGVHRRAFFSECVDKKVSPSVLNLPPSHMVYTLLWPHYLEAISEVSFVM